MRDRWNKMMESFNSKSAYLIYGLVAGIAITAVAGKTKPTQIIVISDNVMGEIMARRVGGSG